MKVLEIIKETATVGATSAGSIATTPNPHITSGKGTSFTGTPGKSGKKVPKTATAPIKTPKNKDGTAKNALDTNYSLFGTTTIKRTT